MRHRHPSFPFPHPDTAGISRRDFLKTQAAGALALAATGLLPSPAFAGDSPATPPIDIAIAEGGPGPAVRKAVELLGGIRRFVKPGQKVVIKPNMSFAVSVERASNTHPEVVRELVALCREAGASRVRVLDHTLQDAQLSIQGFRDACAGFGDDIVHALSSDRFFVETEIPNAVQMKQTEVMRDVLEADVLISAPVAKSHSSAGVSLSMKGMMGLILNRGVMHGRYDLHESIVDLASRLKPALVVVDATRVLTTGGPGGPGKVLFPNLVIASADMVAADAQAVSMFEWYGQKFEPRQVKHIRIAHERGLGRMDVENLRVTRATA